MPIQMRPYHGDPADQLRIAGIVAAQPANCRHLADFPWRLSCPETTNGLNAAIWQAADGTAVAFAAWQMPWAALDIFIRPGPDQRKSEDAVFAWAQGRFRALDDERGSALPYWIEYRDDDPGRRDLGRSRGFDLDEHRYLQLACPLRDRAVSLMPSLPGGFSVRRLAGQPEAGTYAELHRAAFGTTSMTRAWREATLSTPQYLGKLDLVAVAADGTLAGFCIGWLDRARRIGQIEPLGVRPGYQGTGLSRALLAAVLDRLTEAGADTAIVEAAADNKRAIAAYQSAGFRRSADVLAVGRYV